MSAMQFEDFEGAYEALAMAIDAKPQTALPSVRRVGRMTIFFMASAGAALLARK